MSETDPVPQHSESQNGRRTSRRPRAPARNAPAAERWALVADPLQQLIGQSAGIRLVRQQIAEIARSDVAVLVRGETGTGKEVVAEVMARLAGQYPFVAVNCAALAESLIERELFGHVQGAFTGAMRAQPGLIEAAHRRILFLDELVDMPVAVQVKLLRVLDAGEYRPLGSTKTRRSEFRLIAATNADVERSLEEGRLRADLYYRVNAASIWLPPLRDRVEDIPLLAEAFVRHCHARWGRGPLGISPAACAALMGHGWPGNVRQLRHAVEVSAARAGTAPVIEVVHVVASLPPPGTTASPHVVQTLADARRVAEEQAIRMAMHAAEGNRQQAANALRISEATLYRKLRSYNSET